MIALVVAFGVEAAPRDAGASVASPTEISPEVNTDNTDNTGAVVISDAPQPANTNSKRRGHRQKQPLRLAVENFFELNPLGSDLDLAIALGRNVDRGTVHSARQSLQARGIFMPNRKREAARRRVLVRGTPLLKAEHRSLMKAIIIVNPIAKNPELFTMAGFRLNHRVMLELRHEIAHETGSPLPSRRGRPKQQLTIATQAAPATPPKRVSLKVIATPVISPSQPTNVDSFNHIPPPPVRRSRRPTITERDRERAQLLKCLDPSLIKRLPSAMELFAAEEATLIARLGKTDVPT